MGKWGLLPTQGRQLWLVQEAKGEWGVGREPLGGAVYLLVAFRAWGREGSCPSQGSLLPPVGSGLWIKAIISVSFHPFPP